ncbi:MAG: hypothetical protein EOS36_16710 [Mesorhizobium sp.]|nr:MAG: hypothetical protein EOS36_16710 [Mesorhizobium sp.]RWE46342.1 MAG: hypothetical protein EOS79_12265 [Mesorhizobium sp.]
MTSRCAASCSGKCSARGPWLRLVYTPAGSSPGKVRSGFPSGIAQKQMLRADHRFGEKAEPLSASHSLGVATQSADPRIVPLPWPGVQRSGVLDRWRGFDVTA